MQPKQDNVPSEVYPQPPAPLQYGGPILPPPNPFRSAAEPSSAESNKSYVVTVLLSWVVGSFGVDRFYLGKLYTGILKLITLGGLGIWSLIDLILVVFGKIKDTQGRPLAGYQVHAKKAKTLLILYFIVYAAGATLLATYAPTLIGDSQDTVRKNDLTYISAQLANYNFTKKRYPTLVQANSVDFNSLSPVQLNTTKYRDPKGTTTSLVAQPVKGAYAYEALPTGCDNIMTNCTSYQLIATLHNGQHYVLTPTTEKTED